MNPHASGFQTTWGVKEHTMSPIGDRSVLRRKPTGNSRQNRSKGIDRGQLEWKGRATRPQSDPVGAVIGPSPTTPRGSTVLRFLSKISSAHNSPFHLIARNNTEPTPGRRRLAGAGSTLRPLRTFTHSFPSISPTTPTLINTRSYLAPCSNLSSGCMSLNDTRCAGDATRGIPLVRPRHFSESACLRPRVQPRITFPRLLIWTGNGALRWIPVCQAEVNQRSQDVQPSIPDAGLGARVGI